MASVRVASLAIALMLGSATGSMAQMTVGPAGAPGQNPGGFPGQGQGTFPGQGPGTFPGPGPGAAPGVMPGAFPGQSRPQAPPCMAEFAPLRTETEKRAAAIKAAGARHAPPPELCQLFTRFIEAEAKVVKFMEKNAGTCGIPAQVVTTSKANHGKAAETKDRICAAGTGEANEARRGPGLGEALGMRAIPSPDTTTTGGGTLDSLSGNPLKR
jgi:hypothetical protein